MKNLSADFTQQELKKKKNYKGTGVELRTTSALSLTCDVIPSKS